MPALAQYVVRQIATPFALALTVVLLALSLERLLRIVQTITDQGAPVGRAFEVLVYLIPHYLSLAVPAALFLAVLLATRRFQTGQELAAIQSVGIPLTRLLRPVVGFALVLTALLLINAGFVQPHARYAFRAQMHELTEATLALRLQPGVFQQLGKDVMVRADEVSRGGRLLKRFFVVMDRPDGTRTLIAAREARVRTDPETGGISVDMSDGNIVREGPDTPTGSVDFQEYVWEPPSDAVTPYGARGQNEGELTLPELAAGGVPALASSVTERDLRAELHGRLVTTLSMPLLAAIAVPLALFGSGRTGRAYGMVLGIALVVLYEKVIGMAQAFAEGGVLPTWLALWVPFLGLAGLTVLLIAYQTESAGLTLSAWLARRLGRDRALHAPSPAE